MAERAAHPRPWARGEGLALTPAAELPRSAGIERAVRDGIARRYAGPLPPPPAGTRRYLVRADGRTVGVLGIAGGPGPRAATFAGVAIDSAHRGRQLGVRAARVAERRLRREGVRAFLARAPRGNGRGLYFWLRAGFAPAPSPHADDDATWFRLPDP